MDSVSTISAATFLGAIAGSLGGFLFDRLGARACVALGGTLCASGYMLLLFSVVSPLSTGVRTTLAAGGALSVGYSSVCLLDNIVCMVCSLSFPNDRAAVVGYLKAMLGTSGGVWALLWKTLFHDPMDGSGLSEFLLLIASAAAVTTGLALVPMEELPKGLAQHRFGRDEKCRYGALFGAMVGLSLFNVLVSYLLSRRRIQPSPSVGYTDIGLLLVPLLVLLLPPARIDEGNEDKRALASASPPARIDEGHEDKRALASASPTSSVSRPPNQKPGVRFSVAVCRLDFWLLMFIQYVTFGSAIATNQNLALIFESLGHSECAGLGATLFAFTSAVSRMTAGMLSDQYGKYFTRFNWMQVVAACGIVSQALVACMSLGPVVVGVVFEGLSFGFFYTVIVPIVNEMYGPKQFGLIMGTQLASQGVASFTICKLLLPYFYNKARDVGVAPQLPEVSNPTRQVRKMDSDGSASTCRD